MARRTRTAPRPETESDDLFAKPDEDEAPNGKGSNIAKPEGGWDALKTLKSQAKSNGDFLSWKEQGWKPEEEETLVKFLEDGPFASYYNIWVPAKNRSYTTLDPENALTEQHGLRPGTHVLFNVLIAEDDGWTHKYLRASSMLSELIEKMATHDRHGPLTKNYWELSASGTKKNYTPVMNVVKERDLQEDWGIEPISEEELAAYTEAVFTREQVYINSDQDILEVSRDIATGNTSD